jgi:hypothetical protein
MVNIDDEVAELLTQPVTEDLHVPGQHSEYPAP